MIYNRTLIIVYFPLDGNLITSIVEELVQLNYPMRKKLCFCINGIPNLTALNNVVTQYSFIFT